MALAPGTASAPPSQKSFCTSTTINASFGIPTTPFDTHSKRRYVSLVLFALECGDPVVERAGLDRAAQAAHDVLIEMQVMPAEQHGSQDFAARDQMVKIGPAVVAASWAGALLVDRPRIVAMAGIAQVELAV